MYTLYVYNKNEDMFEEFKHFSKLQRAKEFVDNAREIGSLNVLAILELTIRYLNDILKFNNNIL